MTKDRIALNELKFGVYVSSARKNPFEVVEQGIAAERAGFDSFWFPDHFIDDNIYIEHSETWTVLTAVGLNTKDILIASGVTDHLRRHPSATAHTVATLDVLTRGRTILGIGAGEKMNLTPFGIDWTKPVAKLREAVQVILMLWSSSPRNPVDYDGEFYKLRKAFLQINPIQKPHPPIYIGALSPKTREIAGEIADGWLPWINSPRTFKERLKDVEKGVEKAGRSLDEIDKVAVLDVAISEDPEAARRVAEPVGKSALACERDVLRQLGYDIAIPEAVSIRTGIFNEETMRILEETTRKIPLEAVREISAFGTVEDCIKKIESFVKAGATHIVISNLGPDYDNVMKLMKEEIMPYFRKR